MSRKLKNISIFGTSSDAGKSTMTFVLAKILQDLGFSVAPFKAQNVSNNACVADDGSEIAIAQYFQAGVLGMESSYHLNPILLKSGSKNSAMLIVEGRVVENRDIKEYYRDIESLKPIVKRAFLHLDSRYDCVVAEGAGSPVELNLMEKDLSNIYIAKEFDTKIIIVADIEKGGVFASIWGVYNLLPKRLRQNVIGVIINKFRGDMSLFDEGVEIIEKRFEIPVLGVLPYLPLNLGFEDSASLKNFLQIKPNAQKKVAIINYPTMSNYNDFEPLIANSDILVEFITTNQNLNEYSLVILPGSKLVIKDLIWLKKVGLFEQLQNRKKDILGICGGYEMMFENIIDKFGIESENPTSEKGLGFIDDDIIFHKEKILKKGEFEIFGKKVKGFQMRHGVSLKYPLYYEKDNIKGTFVHAIFEDEKFLEYREKKIEEFVGVLRSKLDITRILSEL